MHMQTIGEYAKARGVSTRTVERWLKANRLEDAVKVNDAWLIPAGAVPDDTAAARAERAAHPTPPNVGPDRGARPGSGVAVRQAGAVPALPAAPPTLAELLAVLPAYLPLATAARMLGVTQRAILENPGHFDTQPFGPGDSIRVPKHVIIKAAGL